MREFKGQLAGFPEAVVEKMLEEQVRQGNKCNVTSFETCVTANKLEGGFDWGKSVDDHCFWYEVINAKNFNIFFAKYPKVTLNSVYPKIMMVSDDPIFTSNKGHKRVVFMEKCGKYIAWSNAKTIKESESVIDTASWTYAEEAPTILTVTLTQVAEKFGVPSDQIKIVE